MKTIKVGQRGVVTLPKKMREALGVVEGGVLEVQEKDGTLVIAPHGAGDDAVLASIREGLEDIKCGRYIEFGSIKEFHEKRAKWKRTT